MNRSDINPLPEYFDRYINLTDDVELGTVLQQSFTAIAHFPLANWTALGNRVYAPGKWTVADVLQHVIDTERIFTYRALRFARKDATPLPGFEEANYGEAAGASTRSLDSLIAELKLVRQSTIALYQSFTPDMLQYTGASFKGFYSVGAIGFIIAGHQLHHLNILAERYEPLVG